ncbi:S100P-binding protein [Haplochromis burtoni]|uniref:S100P-binding protein n=1 Tax=Haplochromis burtoni TaxID=8153 RepID=UPI001C2D9BD7|nr:S100P-binding protein [Haplochromis burtoni]
MAPSTLLITHNQTQQLRVRQPIKVDCSLPRVKHLHAGVKEGSRAGGESFSGNRNPGHIHHEHREGHGAKNPHESDKLKAEQSCQVLEEVQENVTEPVQSTLKKEDAAVENSYEATLPLKVQVKSKVQNSNRSTPDSSVVSVPKTEATKPIRTLQPGKSASQRSMVFGSELQWEQEKELYVHSVVSHMYENPGVSNGVTSELRSLMSCVSAGVKSREWQHPSDLTRRNYWRHFGPAAALMTLDEWQAKNCLMHKRFDKIPKIFERSPCP